MKTPSNGTLMGIVIIGMIIYATFKHFTSPKSPEEKKVTIENGYYKPITEPDTAEAQMKPYKILEEDTSRIGDKYQSLISASMEDSNYTQDQMKSYLYEIYNNELNNPVFKGFIKPNAVGVYLWSSETKYQNTKGKGEWEMMLYKNFNDKEPKFSLSLSNGTATDNSEKTDYESIKKKFEAKGLDYCAFYYQVEKWITQANKIEQDYDDLHPNSFLTASDKADKWLDHKMNTWLRKNHLPDSLGTMVGVYGPAFCK